MSSTGTTISRSSSFGLPASAISHLRRGPTRKRAILSSGRCVAERPIRWTSRTPLPAAGPSGSEVAARCESRSRVSARWAPRFDCATAWISSTITASAPVEDLPCPRGHDQVERLGGRDQDVGRLAAHRLALALRRVAGAQADGDLRADSLQRRAQVALDVVGERLERRDVDDPHPLARAAPAREPAGRSPTGRRRASFPTRWGRRSACWLRRRSSASPSPGRASGSANDASNQRLTGSLKGPAGWIWQSRIAWRSTLRSYGSVGRDTCRPCRRLAQGSESAISARRGAVRSRSERIGSEIGHSTPTSGSSQAIPASVAGS